MTWTQVAGALAFGQSRKIPHCGPDASASVSNHPRGMTLYCFRCGEKDFRAHEKASLDYLLNAMAAEEAQAASQYPTITPLTGGVPSEARLWGLRCGLSPEVLESHGFGWNSRMSRVVYPHLALGEPDGRWGARAVFKGQVPKYIAARGESLPWSIGESDRVVVVEDVLSAIKVHRAGYAAVAATGTSIDPMKFVSTFPSVRRVDIWLDPDTPGRNAAGKLRKSLAAFGIETRTIQSGKDPKYYTRAEIRNAVDETN